MDHDFGTIISTTVNPRDDTSSQDETNGQDKNKNHDYNVVSSSSDNRKTISVVIDEDEYDTDLSTSFASVKSPVENDFRESIAAFSDHNYVFGAQRPKPSNSNFPIIEGLNLDRIEDNNATPFLPRTQQTLRPPNKRYAQYGYDAEDGNSYTGSSGYYRNQLKGNFEGPERLTQQKLQYGLPNSQKRQQISGSERLSLRPSGHGRAVQTAISTIDNPYSTIPSDTGSVPPQRSYGNIRLDSPYILDGSPAPIVTATRGRPTSGRNKVARTAQDGPHLVNQTRSFGRDPNSQTGYILPIQTGYSSEQQKKQLPEQRQQQRFRQLHKRNVSLPYVGGSVDKQQKQHFDEQQQQQMEDQQRHDIYLEEEEMLNEDFFAQQHQKYSLQQQSSDVEKSGGGRVRKDTITPSDPVQPMNTSPNLLDASKPPDDPYLPPQQVSQYPGLGLKQQIQHQQRHYLHGFDTSSIDGTINAVVRGEASVMQQHFGPPISSETLEGSSISNFQQQQFESQQQAPHFERSSSMNMSYVSGQPSRQPQQQNVQTFGSNSAMIRQQRLTSSQTTLSHGLDELAQASSNLLEQSMTTRSDGIEDIYQQEPSLIPHPKQQSQFHPGQHPQTLHFKVVQTNHRDEPSSFPQHQNYMQQVFTVQQRQRPADSAPSDLPHSDDRLKFSPPSMSPIRQRGTRIGSSGGSGRRQRLSTEFSPVPIAPKGGIEAEDPELQQAGDFTKPIKWQRSFRRQTSNESDAKKTSIVSVRASNASESLVKNTPKNIKGRGPYKRRSNVENKETQQQEGLDYITRCICGMKHNDPFMIQCDRCDVWQHGVCMCVKEDKVPDTYLCEQCQPRNLELTPKQAKSIQVRNLIEAKAPKSKKTKSKSFSIKYRSKTPALSAALKITSKIRRTKMSIGTITKRRGVPRGKGGIRPSYKSFVSVNVKEEKPPTKRQKLFQKYSSNSEHNQYSSGAKSLMASLPPYVLGEIGLLRRLDHNPLARPMLVAPNVEGLVATPGKNSNIPMGMPIVEYTGTISLLSEVKNPSKMIGDKFTLIYSGLGDNNKVLVDATKSGPIARSVRRSCRSNATLQHAIVDGQLRIYLYAAMNIDRSSEVTIPFDYDYRKAREPVECACNTLLGMSFMDHCPIYAFNKSLQSNADNKITSDRSAVSLISKNSPVSSHQRQTCSPRQTRNSMSSPITVKFEKDTTSTFEKQKSPLKTEHVIDEHKSSDDSLLAPLSTIRSQRRSPRTSSSIEAKIPKLELAKSPTPNDPKFVNSALLESTLLESKVVSRKLLSSSSPTTSPKRTSTSPTRVSHSNTLTTMGKIKWGEKPPPNKRKDSLSPSKRITTRLSDTPTSPRLAASLSKKPKKEESDGNADANFVDYNHKMSREERKLQATIASIERAEHLSQEKKRKQIEKIHPPSEPPITTKLKRKSFNAKTSSVKSLPDESSNYIGCKKLFEELNKILKKKLDKLQDFELPSDFDALRTEVMRRSKATDTSCIVKSIGKVSPSKSEDHSKRTGKRSKSLRGSLGYATTSKASITGEEKTEEQQTFYNQKMVSPESDGCVWEKEQISECSRHLSLSIPELIKDSKTASAPPTTINTSSDASDVDKPERASIMDVDTETPIRPPNTKAHKKITLEEYKRKKKAEMEAKQQQDIEENTADKKSLTSQEPSTSRPSSSATLSASSLVATRHSPRKSFIPAISSLPSSPPQQLEDFAPSPPAIGGRHKQLFSTPSLDELKKRIHGDVGFLSSAGSAVGEELAETQSHPPLPLDMPPPPPPKSRPQSERQAMSLDDRLKKFVKRTS